MRWASRTKPGFLFLDPPGQEEARQHGCHHQRENQRTGKRENHRQRHRLEQFSFHALQRKDGQEYNEDDADAERDGPDDFKECRAQDLLAFFFLSP